ncbi:NAD(P)-dependent oxidoreductase [Roseiterribacter gracilis]|uniref:3-hydroxyisobutyrate dehydrogenase n=1 Tax=Roseiterribacter gracilis TaxID=2812848 RepID=A0A8S8XGD2_9PROT|nr:3-hydroxyisobutyrate dehydrogenase [Rhodospirillales bacterium TMPK1]
MRVAVIGIGKMGAGIAHNLVKAGHTVTVWNRSRDKAAAIEGARVANSVAEAARDAEVALTMLSDDTALAAALNDGLFDALPRGAIHVSSSTISASLSDRIADDHAARGQDYVAAPVFGRPDVAAAAQLTVIAAGPAAVIDRAQPVFDAIGRRTWRVGDRPSQANIVKLCGNYLIVSSVQSLGEAVALARGADVDTSVLLELLTENLFSGRVHTTYGGAIVEKRYRPAGFGLDLALKDVRLVLAAADAADVPMPVASLLHDAALAALHRSPPESDVAALAEFAAKNAGLPD